MSRVAAPSCGSNRAKLDFATTVLFKKSLVWLKRPLVHLKQSFINHRRSSMDGRPLGRQTTESMWSPDNILFLILKRILNKMSPSNTSSFE